MATVSEQAAGSERRKASRVKTARDLVFSGNSGLLREGTVVDVSSTGVQIRCAHPEPDGTKLDAEIQANPSNPGSLPIVARGRVAHVRELKAGEFVMGVELTLHPAGRKNVGKAPYLFRGGHDATDSKPVRPTSRPSAGADGDRNRTRRRWLGVACLAVLFLVALFLMGRLDPPVSAQDNGLGEQVEWDRQAPSVEQRSPSRTDQMRPQAVRDTDAHFSAVSPLALKKASASSSEPQARSGVLRARRSSGRSGRSVPLPGGGSPGDDKPPQPHATRTAGRNETKSTHARPTLAVIMTTWGLGKGGPATGEARPGQDRPWDTVVLASGESSPHRSKPGAGSTPVLAVTEPPRTGLRASVERPESEGHPLSNAVRTVRNRKRFLGPVPRFSEAAEHDVFLVVDRGRFLLTVFVRGAPVRQFPVSVGRNDSTPTGRFQIINKLTDPDWYNRGETVRAGDPRNPLGRRWLGLASSDASTGHGLHPTQKAGSIGRPASRGCIRLRPEDAETLFRLCPVGTPVEICG